MTRAARFSGASSRPEPLFEPRPLEGDEKTGDTRDAGDDERLKAIERRVADGRAEEGDAEELDAAGESQKPAAEAKEPEDKPKGQDSDKDDAEGDADEDAARWALTHDGKPVKKIEIDVGGETKQVSLQEVVKGYAEQEAINQRARQVEEYARTFEQQSAQSPRRSARPARPTSSGSNISAGSWPTSIPRNSIGKPNTPPIRGRPTTRKKSTAMSAAA